LKELEEDIDREGELMEREMEELGEKGLRKTLEEELEEVEREVGKGVEEVEKEMEEEGILRKKSSKNSSKKSFDPMSLFGGAGSDHVNSLNTDYLDPLGLEAGHGYVVHKDRRTGDADDDDDSLSFLGSSASYRGIRKLSSKELRKIKREEEKAARRKAEEDEDEAARLRRDFLRRAREPPNTAENVFEQAFDSVFGPDSDEG
jgi:hypothetical protein